MRVLVTGAGGQLGRSLARALVAYDLALLDIHDLDVTAEDVVAAVLERVEPDVIVHAAAWTDVDGCERDPDAARAVNTDGTGHVVAHAKDARVIAISTDYVFDGSAGRAYTEDDEPSPVSVYGRTKLDAERIVLDAGGTVVRSAWLYGHRWANGAPARNFVASIVRAAARGEPLDVVDDQVGSPTSTSDLADGLAALVARADARGIFHVVNEGAVSRYEFARAILARAGLDPELVRPIATADAPPLPARRPPYAPLDGARWREAGFAPLPSWEDALARTLPAIVEANR